MVTLTRRQVEIIKSTFAILTPESIVRLAEIFYAKLFRVDSNFDQHILAHVKIEDRITTFASALTTIVDSVGNYSVLVPSLKELGVEYSRLGITPKHYGWDSWALINAFEEVFNDDFTNELQKAWFSFCENIIETMQSDVLVKT